MGFLCSKKFLKIFPKMTFIGGLCLVSWIRKKSFYLPIPIPWKGSIPSTSYRYQNRFRWTQLLTFGLCLHIWFGCLAWFGWVVFAWFDFHCQRQHRHFQHAHRQHNQQKAHEYQHNSFVWHAEMHSRNQIDIEEDYGSKCQLYSRKKIMFLEILSWW